MSATSSAYHVRYVRVSPTTVRAVITVPPRDVPTSSRPVSRLVLVADVSGSMIGQRLQLVSKMASDLLKVSGTADLITYNHVSQTRSAITSMPSLTANGGTSFTAALKALLQVLININEPVQVIFLTDGEAQDGKIECQQYLQLFNKCLTGRQVAIHAIGIDCDAYTPFLLSITQSGTVPGSFGYLDTRQRDSSSVTREFERLHNIISVGQRIIFRGQTYFVTEPEFSVYLSDSTMETTGVVEPCTVLDEIDYFAYQVNQQVLNASTIKLPDVVKLQEQALQLYQKAGRASRADRKLFRTRLGEVNAVITQWYSLLSNQVTLTNEQLATLNVAAREARSDRFLKVTTKRSHSNAENIIVEDAAIEEAISVCKQHPTKLPQTCTISQLSVDELLEEGDCLGVGISALTNEVCVVDPTRLKVQDISTCYYGSNVFLDLAVWTGKLQTAKFGVLNNLTMDAGRRPISGVLPLYLNETHWSIAKHYVRRMAGHLTCLDPLLATNSTIFYSYLLAYLKCREITDEVHQIIAAQLLETLQHIHCVLPSPRKFLEVAHRSPTEVPDLLLMIEWYQLPHPLWTDQDLPPWEVLTQYISEEQDRRAKRFITRGYTSGYLEFDKEKWITPYVNAHLTYTDKGIDFSSLRTWLATHYPDAVAAFDVKHQSTATAESSTSIVTVPDVDSYLPVYLKHTIDDHMDSRAILMALQQARYPHSQEFIDHYQDYVAMPVEEVERQLITLAREELSVMRKSALTAAQAAIDNDSLGYVLKELATDPDTLMWAAALFSNCYIGRNITSFAQVSTTTAHQKMLITGECDIAPLLDYPTPIIIPTVRDMHRRKCLTPGYHELPQITIEKCWVPTIQYMKRMLQTYGLKAVLGIFPEKMHYLINAINY